MEKPIFIESLGKDKHGSELAKFTCQCGTEFITHLKSVNSGHTKSCGCYRKMNSKKLLTTHGESKTKLHKCWKKMLDRCFYPREKDKKYYTDKKITACNDWLNYIPFKNWALINGYKDGLSLDRIDNDKGYYPENCRWVTTKIQSINRSSQPNKYGFPGIHFCPENTNNPWGAMIHINKKPKIIGYFSDPQSAHLAYLKAKKERDDMYYNEFNKQNKIL